jgi:CYTH domain-containing protein
VIRGLDEELAAHKYAHVERERRFLVDPKRCPGLSVARAIRIEDRYVTGTRFRLRRMTELASGRVVLKLSKKYDVTDVRARPLVTAYLTDVEYSLFAALPALPIDKVRYRVVEGPNVFGVDRFEEALAGLLMAEIECEDAGTLAAVTIPAWVKREVTDDPAYQGGSLAARGLPEEKTVSQV